MAHIPSFKAEGCQVIALLKTQAPYYVSHISSCCTVMQHTQTMATASQSHSPTDLGLHGGWGKGEAGRTVVYIHSVIGNMELYRVHFIHDIPSEPPVIHLLKRWNRCHLVIFIVQ